MGEVCGVCKQDEQILTHLIVLSHAVTNDEVPKKIAILNQQEEESIMTYLMKRKLMHFDTVSKTHVCIELFDQRDNGINPEHNHTQQIQSNLRLIIGQCPIGSQLIEGQGLIIYNSAYYFGQIHQNKAHGKGIFYFLNPITLGTLELRVEGLWTNNHLIQGNFTNGITKQQLMKLKMNAKRQKAEIVFPCRTKYIGSVKLKGISSQKQLITGNGEMHFPNGDKYIGSVYNGNMQTEANEEATYIKSNCQTYFGEFKCNRRDGRGLLTFWIGTQQLMLDVHEWKEGKPVGVGKFHRIFENGERKSIDVQFNQEGKLSSSF